MSICKKNHRYNDIFKNLPDSQKPEDGRHLCAGCAYENGFIDGFNNQRHTLDQLNLPASQAGTVRHKSVSEAYKLGWKKGNELRN